METRIPSAIAPRIFGPLVLGLTLTAAARAADRVDASLPWSARMADSIMARQPKGVMIENAPGGTPKWSYSAAFCVRAITQVGIGKGPTGEKYLRYGRDYMDAFVNDAGVISRAYDARGHRLDDIAPGQLLLLLQAETKEDKYKKAALQLAEQFKTQPRVDGGGFWHKDIYPNQMWLDGIFMDSPFMARLATLVEPDASKIWFDEVTLQITLLAQHAQDPATGLCYHGWDASKKERWADPQTGLSKCFWARGLGWYMAGIVETLDYLPADHPRRNELLAILVKAADGLQKVQDDKTGLWFQVLDQGARQGNYTESSASGMFAYVLAKSARKGYLPPHFAGLAQKAYAGLLREKISVDPATGLISLKDTCQVAGLGANPYRDGTFDYYIREPRATNDPKGLAPFILASLELESSHPPATQNKE